MSPSVATSEAGDRARCRILIEGVVLGVGFRPFVYNLAELHQLSGLTNVLVAECAIQSPPTLSLWLRANSHDALQISGNRFCALSHSGRQSAGPIGQRALEAQADSGSIRQEKSAASHATLGRTRRPTLFCQGRDVSETLQTVTAGSGSVRASAPGEGLFERSSQSDRGPIVVALVLQRAGAQGSAGVHLYAWGLTSDGSSILARRTPIRRRRKEVQGLEDEGVWQDEQGETLITS